MLLMLIRIQINSGQRGIKELQVVIAPTAYAIFGFEPCIKGVLLLEVCNICGFCGNVHGR